MTIRAPELTAAREPAAPRVPAAWRWALIALTIAVLFFVYWRESKSAAANSDSAATALQSWDMLHGNWLLRSWWMSDVSFYTTEIPQYALLELFGGFGVWVVHVAAAMSYTLIVVLTALLAKGHATGREGWTRAVLAGGIVASPQVNGALIFLLGPDHTGTMVPVLATWLLIDRARPRWFVPVLVCVALTWIMVGDAVVLFTGIAPLIVAAVVRAVRPARPGQRWYELSLAAAAVVAAGLGTLVPKLIAHFGGFQVWRFQTHTMPLAKLPHDTWDTIRAVLQLFGADVFSAHPAVETILVAVHFAGVLLAIAGLVLAVSRFVREDGIAIPALAVAIVVELGAFLISIHSSNLGSVREIVAVMPFGAVLAGRTLAAPLLRAAAIPAHRNWLAPVTAVVLAGYLGAMVYGAAQPTVPSANQGLATWLTDHGLTNGLAAYWQAGSVTLDTSGKITVNGVVIGRHGRIGPYYWETDTSQYDPAKHYATFLVAGGPHDVAPIPGLAEAAIRTFGPPAHVYRTQGYTILVWPRNILRQLG